MGGDCGIRGGIKAKAAEIKEGQSEGSAGGGKVNEDKEGWIGGVGNV